ncbi:hypothetical protein GF327_01880 [Candidatus Woesearchaeota archaeon]|nr:hypothetical protein [Candidatus Woesearchaeota archaeon]
MLEFAYDVGKREFNEEKLLSIITKKNLDLSTTYKIYFDLDKNSLEINSVKYTSIHPTKYIFFTVGGNVQYHSPSCQNISKITGEANNGCNIKGMIDLFEDKQEREGYPLDILKEIMDKFYPEGKLIDSFRDELPKDENDNLYTVGYIKGGKKSLFSELKEYRKALIEYKFPTSQELSNKNLCDFCGKEKFIIPSFGNTAPYKLVNLKMFTSTYTKGFYQNDNRNIYKTIRCCTDCFKKIKYVDGNLKEDNRIAILKEEKKEKKKGSKRKSVTVYLFVSKFPDPLTKFEYTDVKETVEVLFQGNRTTGKKIQNLSELKGRFLAIDDVDSIHIHLFFNESKQNKNQVLLEIRDLDADVIAELIDTMNYMTNIKRLIELKNFNSNKKNPNYLFNITYMFKLISLINYKLSLLFIKDLFHKSPSNIKDLIARFSPHLRSSVYGNFYRGFSTDVALILSLSNILKQGDYTMGKINESLILKKLEKDDEIEYKIKPLRKFVTEIYRGISDEEILLMEIGELISDISRRLHVEGKKDRAKIFLSKIRFNGMDNEDLKEYIVFINKKLQQYENDLGNLVNRVRSKLNEVTISVQNSKVDKNIAVLRIIDGYNLKERIQWIKYEKNEEVK